MRIVITGAGGQVGRFLAARAVREGRDVLALASSQWDITDPAAAERIVRSGDMVINCAAYTNVDGAESDEATAHAVNATDLAVRRALADRAPTHLAIPIDVQSWTEDTASPKNPSGHTSTAAQHQVPLPPDDDHTHASLVPARRLVTTTRSATMKAA